jgi:pimeloyl-ACP methyl ester carboxylesterase
MPGNPGVPFADVEFAADHGERLHGWWVPATGGERRLGHVLLFHGNAGNISDRVPHIELLASAGFDVLAFDARGYGRSTGRPSEPGTYLDARAALAALLRRPGVDRDRVVYLGASRSSWRCRPRPPGWSSSRPSPASATWRACTIRSSRAPRCRTRTRACG